MDMAVYERLVKNDVQTLGYFAVERGASVLVLIGDQPHLATVATVPLTGPHVDEAAPGEERV